MLPEGPSHEETLDPENWEQLRSLLHEMIDDSVDFIKNVRDRRPWTSVPESVKTSLSQKAPLAGIGAEQTYQEFKDTILPYPKGNIHPKFWAWYMGNGSMMGMMGEYLTALINSNAGAGNHIGQYVEDQVIQWMIDIIGYPSTASGLLTSGGSMANFVGLSVARNTKANYDIRKEGVKEGKKQLRIYASTEVHNCNLKAAQLLGIGEDNLVMISTNEDFTINTELLKSKINEDIHDGYQPICIIGSAGTVNTGAIDDLNTLAALCDEFNLWFHF